MSHPLPNYLRMFRKRSGLAQDEVAQLLGSRHGSKVSRYEVGARAPTFETLLALEVVFRACLTELYAGEVLKVSRQVRSRARSLYRALDAVPAPTLAVKRKRDFLADLISPPKR